MISYKTTYRFNAGSVRPPGSVRPGPYAGSVRLSGPVQPVQSVRAHMIFLLQNGLIFKVSDNVIDFKYFLV